MANGASINESSLATRHKKESASMTEGEHNNYGENGGGAQIIVKAVFKDN